MSSQYGAMGGDDDTNDTYDTKETDGLLPTATPPLPSAEPPTMATSAGVSVVSGRSTTAATTYERNDDLIDHKRVSVDGGTSDDGGRRHRRGKKLGFRQALRHAYNLNEIIIALFYRDDATSTGTSDRLPALDGVRALAFLWVAAEHLSITLRYQYSSNLIDTSFKSDDDGEYGFSVVLKELVDQGGFGVTIFFVLSGFLIPLVIVRGYRAHGRINLRRFMWHRFLRVWPALNTYVPLSVIWAQWFNPDYYRAQLSAYFVAPCESGWWTNAVFLTDVAYCFDVDMCQGHLWTVSTEWQLYFVTPLLVSLYLRRPRTGITAVLVFTAAANAFYFYYFNTMYLGGDAIWCDYGGASSLADWPIQRFAEYAMGMLAAFAFLRRQGGSREGAAAGAAAPGAGVGVDWFDRIKGQRSFQIWWNVWLAAAMVGTVVFLTVFTVFEWQRHTNAWSEWKNSEAVYTVFAGLVAVTIYTALDEDLGQWMWGPLLGHWVWYPLANLSYTGYLWSMCSGVYTLYITTWLGFGYYEEGDDDGAPPTRRRLDYNSSGYGDNNSLGMAGWCFAYMLNLVILCTMAMMHSVLVERPAMRLRHVWK